MEKKKLKRCPFCGSKDVGLFDSDPENPSIPYDFYVSCQDCSAGISCYESSKEAIKAWNTRPQAEARLIDIDKFYEWLDAMTTQESDEHSLTSRCETFYKLQHQEQVNEPEGNPDKYDTWKDCPHCGLEQAYAKLITGVWHCFHCDKTDIDQEPETTKGERL